MLEFVCTIERMYKAPESEFQNSKLLIITPIISFATEQKLMKNYIHIIYCQGIYFVNLFYRFCM